MKALRNRQKSNIKSLRAKDKYKTLEVQGALCPKLLAPTIIVICLFFIDFFLVCLHYLFECSSGDKIL